MRRVTGMERIRFRRALDDGFQTRDPAPSHAQRPTGAAHPCPTIARSR